MAKSKKAEPAPDPDALFQHGELAKHPPVLLKRAFDAYNVVAAAAGWPETANLTESRQKRLKVALQDCGGLAGWESALARAAKSDFLCGKTKSFRAPTGFKGTKLDFFLRSDRRASLLDGEYDNRDAAPAPRASFQSRMAAASGPVRPAKELPFVQTETREQRMAGTILSYRRLGRYDDANRVEAELAKAEGRPPVLVPHPGAARFGMPPSDPVEKWDSGSTIADVPDDHRPDMPPAKSLNGAGNSAAHGKSGGNYSEVMPADEDPGWGDDVPEGDPAQAEP